jgi:hypothetical protein
MSFFDKMDLGALQVMLLPLVKSVTGVDVQGFLSSKSGALTAAADGLNELADVLHLAGEALLDGVLTNAEINGLVEESKDLPGAYSAILAAVAIKKSVN